ESLNIGGSFGNDKYHVRLVRKDNPLYYLLWSGTAVEDDSGYKTFTLNSQLASSHTSPFSDGQTLILTATIIGQKGEDGTNGTNGTNGDDGADGAHGGAISFEYTWSDTTTEADPGTGQMRVNTDTQA